MAQLPTRQPEWIDTAPIVVRRQRKVSAPPEAVWKHIADHKTWPQWFKGVKSVLVTGAPEGVGGQRVVTVAGATLGEVFTAWEPDERFAFSVITGPPALAGLAESVVIEPDGDGCTVIYTQGIDPAPGFGWLVKLASKRMGNLLGKALDALAARAEVDHVTSAADQPTDDREDDDTPVEPDAALEVGPEGEAESATEPELGPEPMPGPEPAIEADPARGAEPEAAAESKPSAGAGSELESVGDGEHVPGPVSQSRKEAAPRVEPGQVADAGSGAVVDVESDSAPEQASKPRKRAAPGTEPRPKPKTDSQAELDFGLED